VSYVGENSSFTATYDAGNGTVVWEVGDLPEEEVLSWTVTVQVSGTALTNTVVAHTPDVEHDGTEGNTTSMQTVALNYLAGAPGEPTLGTALWQSDALTITVENQGLDTLHALTVTLPGYGGG
jgi:hypothetical protein